MEFISSQTISESELLVSFDVSLFTNIPVSLAIDVAHRRLEEDESLSERTTLPVEGILMLLQLCLNATYLSFRGNYYSDGVSSVCNCGKPGYGGD